MRCMKQPCIAQRRPHLLPGAPRASLVDFGSKTRTVRQKWCPWRSWQQTRSTLGNAGLFHTPLMVELFPIICVWEAMGGGAPLKIVKKIVGNGANLDHPGYFFSTNVCLRKQTFLFWLAGESISDSAWTGSESEKIADDPGLTREM